MEAPGSVINCLIVSNKKLTPLAVLIEHYNTGPVQIIEQFIVQGIS